MEPQILDESGSVMRLCEPRYGPPSGTIHRAHFQICGGDLSRPPGRSGSGPGAAKARASATRATVEPFRARLARSTRCGAIPIMAGMAAPCLPGSMPAAQSNPMLSASVESASPSSTMASRQAQYAVGLSACIERRNAYADLTRWFRSSPVMKCTTQMAHCKVH